MKKLYVAAIILGSVLFALDFVRANEPAKQAATDLDKARRTAWQLVMLVIDPLRTGAKAEFPGNQAWLKDFDRMTKGIDAKTSPDEWPPFDADALTIRNPHFWRMYYEIAPADPGLMLLQGGLLLSAGEAVRASHLIVVAKQRPGIPKQIQEGFDILLA